MLDERKKLFEEEMSSAIEAEQKELIKENKRDYTNENHWNLKAEAIEQLYSFLTQNLK